MRTLPTRAELDAAEARTREAMANPEASAYQRMIAARQEMDLHSEVWGEPQYEPRRELWNEPEAAA